MESLNRYTRAALLSIFAAMIIVSTVGAQGISHRRSRVVLASSITVSVGTPTAASYNNSDFPDIPDEFVSGIAAPTTANPARVLYFISDEVGGNTYDHGSVGMLRSDDHLTFTEDANYSVPLYLAPGWIGMGANGCTATNRFDDYYSAPGAVLPVPSASPGTLLMILHGENHKDIGSAGHCDASIYYASVGLRTSTDNGKTWSGATQIISGPQPKPTNTASPSDTGDAIPSAVYNPDDGNLYVFYENRAYNQISEIQVARAQVTSPTSMGKWNGTDWTQSGINGSGTQVLPTDAPGSPTDCNNTANVGQIHANVTYNRFLGEYFMVLLCQNSDTRYQWYWSVSNDLNDEVWSTPVPIPDTTQTPPNLGEFYPSVFETSTNTSEQGAGYILFGCCHFTDKTMKVRNFSITTM